MSLAGERYAERVFTRAEVESFRGRRYACSGMNFSGKDLLI